MDKPPESFSDDSIDFADLFSRLRRGFRLTVGLALLGIAVVAIGYIAISPVLPRVTSARTVFSFSGYEHGLYPDHSKFEPDDLRAPEVISAALKRLGFDTSNKFQSEIRSALTVEGIIPTAVITERDRLRAAGQFLPPLIPDEHRLTLSLEQKFPLNTRQRELLLNEIVNAFRERFMRTYSELPASFGNAFDALKDADYFEYELILNEDLENISSYLDQMLDDNKTFRSSDTNFSFSDLQKQTNVFKQIRLNETLGLIRQYGLSKSRQGAMTKMNYYIGTLESQENRAAEEAKVIEDLLAKSQAKADNYVLGIKSQASQGRSEAPILDQNLIDSLLANDAYNFLVRQALAAGLKLKRIQGEKSVWLERRKAMEVFLNSATTNEQSKIIEDVQKSLEVLQKSYATLLQNIRLTQSDFERQRFADVIRMSMQPSTENYYKKLVIAAGVGAMIGAVLGLALSLLKPAEPKNR